MCGIAGVCHFDGEEVDPHILRRMIETIRYRGPDTCDVVHQEGAGLAHARLSIIDIEGGNQPMSNADGTLTITFNGEIFNYIELRKAMERKGHRFATNSDTEVILHLYEMKGVDCVEDFNGQWAFAIWDSTRRRLFLSRDRLGIRPLFYSVVGRFLIFGSEIKALFAHPGAERRLDLAALDQIFTFWSPIGSRTMFEGVLELPPGHSLVVENGAPRLVRYWQPRYAPEANPMSEEDYADRLLELLTDATRIRLRSDVPVGAYLSGGLDSTIIAALISRIADSPLKTFSVSFDDPAYDESAYQKQVVAFLGTDHEEIRCAHRDIRRVFPEVVWHAEKPILRSAPAPLFLLSGLARDKGYKVVLTGEGADETLGGYDIFKEAKIRSFWAARPDSKIRPLLLKRLYPYLGGIQSQSQEYLEAFFRGTHQDLENPFFSHYPRWEMTARLKLFYSDAVKNQLRSHDPYAEMERLIPADYQGWDGFSRAQYLELAALLPGYILSSQGDRMAMAHSIEGRFPFLDYRLVEFAGTVPPRLKMKALNEKYLLKRAVGELIPPSIKNRRKHPYRAPEGECFVNPKSGSGSSDYVEELLSPDRIKSDGVFNPAAVKKLADKMRAGKAVGTRDNMAFIGILSTQLLIDKFINRFSAEAANAVPR